MSGGNLNRILKNFFKEGDMKHLLLIIALAAALGCAACNTDWSKAAGAASDLGAAASASDDELKQVSAQMRVQGDSAANVASAKSKYGKRLARLTNKHRMENGQPLNFKVYITSDVNANATADGSIRVYSGLMDMMTDDELLFVLGHEIGHVINQDSLKAMRTAYAASAARKGVGAANATAAALSDSALGDLLEAVLNAQFSQSQESNADAYGLEFMKRNHYNTAAAVSALRKLQSLSGKSGGMDKLLSSHPDPGKRADVMAAKAASGK